MKRAGTHRIYLTSIIQIDKEFPHPHFPTRNNEISLPISISAVTYFLLRPVPCFVVSFLNALTEADPTSRNAWDRCAASVPTPLRIDL